MSRGRSTASQAKIFGTVLYALCCSIAIVVLSVRDYEWMIGEREVDGSVLTICSIPTSADDPSDVARLVTLGMVAVLLVFGLERLVRRKAGEFAAGPERGIAVAVGISLLGAHTPLPRLMWVAQGACGGLDYGIRNSRESAGHEVR